MTQLSGAAPGREPHFVVVGAGRPVGNQHLARSSRSVKEGIDPRLALGEGLMKCVIGPILS